MGYTDDVDICETKCYLKDGNLFMRNREQTVANLSQVFPEQEDFVCVFRVPVESKTEEQLGYFWNELAVKAHHRFRELGYDFLNKEQTVEYWMKEILQFVQVVDTPTGPVVYLKERISGMNKKTLHWLTEQFIRFCVSDLELEIQTADRFKKARKINK